MIEIRHNETERAGIFEAWIDTSTVPERVSSIANDVVAATSQIQAGEMTYKRTTPDRMVIDHTQVFDGFEGQGIARQMVSAAVAFARKEGRTIIPVCSYAQSVLTRTDEYKDILT